MVYFFLSGLTLSLKNFHFVRICCLPGDKAESGEDSEYDELTEGVDDLSRVVEGKPIKLRRKKKKKKEDENEEPKTPVYEVPIVAEDFIPLQDDTIAKTDGKGLLNVRVIFVIGELVFVVLFCFFLFNLGMFFCCCFVVHVCAVYMLQLTTFYDCVKNLAISLTCTHPPDVHRRDSI